MLRSLH